uniref:ZP domain-containing protein n=1 Tax=Trichuris muris TaxID=70415 RepID=A0A5S6Q7B4_TRIMR
MNCHRLGAAVRLLISALLVANGRTIKFQNDFAAVPEIECNPEAIIVKLNTTSGMASKIFVRGHHDEANCSFQQTNTARFPLQDCGIVRERQLKPKGLAVTSTFVVQLHPFFITKLDRAYKVRCFYVEAERTITSNLEVSTISASPIDQQTPLPQCTYSLRMERPDGEPVRYARIGDRVWHVWECDSADTYGMLVHSCSVRDGKGNQIEIIDDKGCALDDFIMDTPKYNDSLGRADQETLVFKFADVLAVQFHCQIRLCLKANNGCDGVTPPVCENRTRTLQLVSVKPEPIGESADNKTEAAVTHADEPAALRNESVANDSQITEAPAEETTDGLQQDSLMPANLTRTEAMEVGQADGSAKASDASSSSLSLAPANGRELSSNASTAASTPEEDGDASEAMASGGDEPQSSGGDLMNDTRSRRNVYSEPWFTDAPYFDMPGSLEADVSQEILVLDVGDSGASLKGDDEDWVDSRLPLRDAQGQLPDSSRRVCLTSGALAAVISGFVFVIMLLSLAVFVMLIKRHQARVSMVGTYSRCDGYKF